MGTVYFGKVRQPLFAMRELLPELSHWHLRPGIYLRQMDLPDIDTKSIEGQRSLLGELPDLILSSEVIDTRFTGAGGFAQRYGFKPKPTQIRLRLLDPMLFLHGLSDLIVISREFAALNLPASRIYITENEINFLSFPDQADSLVLFGSGYGFDHLAASPCLRDKEIIYWGDLDTHGFAILDQLRSAFPGVRSILMNRETLLAHQSFWGREERSHERIILTSQLCVVRRC